VAATLPLSSPATPVLLRLDAVTNDDAAPIGPDDVRPGDHVVRADARGRRRCADAEPLEQAQPADADARHLRRSLPQLRAEVVDPAEVLTRLCPDWNTE